MGRRRPGREHSVPQSFTSCKDRCHSVTHDGVGRAKLPHLNVEEPRGRPSLWNVVRKIPNTNHASEFSRASPHRSSRQQAQSPSTCTKDFGRSLHHTDRVAKVVHLITPTALQTSGVCTAKRVAASPHKHVCSFRQTLSRTRSLDEAAHDEKLKAPTSRSTLKERMKTRSTIRGRCVSHIMWPRSTPFPSERRVWCGSHVMWPRTHPFPALRICSCTSRAWRSSRQAKPWSMSHLGMPSRLCCNRRDARSKATKCR